MLKLDRTAVDLQACEDPTAYTKPQIQRLLAALHAGVHPVVGSRLCCAVLAQPGGRVPNAADTAGREGAGCTGVGALECLSSPPFSQRHRSTRGGEALLSCWRCPPCRAPVVLLAGNQAHGGLQLVCEAHAIVGCCR